MEAVFDVSGAYALSFSFPPRSRTGRSAVECRPCSRRHRLKSPQDQTLKTQAYNEAGSIKELEQKIAATAATGKEAKQTVRKLENHIKDLAEIIKYAEQYKANKAYNIAYKKAKRYQELVEEGDGFEDDRDAYTMENVFFVPEDARWSTIASAAHTPEIGTVFDNAMRAIEAENKTLKNVLPKNYASPDFDKRVLADVVDIFTNNIDMHDTTESEDLLGRTYEYCIAQFAEKEGVGGGEFYTPSSVVKTLVSILRPFDNCRVYDCC